MTHPIDNRYHFGIVYNLDGKIAGFNLSPDIHVPLTDNDIEKALEYYIEIHCPLENEQGEKMTKEEAIEQLEYTILLILQDDKDYMDERDIPVLKMAIQALKQQPKTECCKNCKRWKDSDGVYRRCIGAESKCPINCKEVYEGNGYCFMYEPQKPEVEE